MIVTTDIANILYRDCQTFGISIVPHGKKLTGPMKSERIVIHAKKQQPETVFRRGELLRSRPEGRRSQHHSAKRTGEAGAKYIG